MPTLDAITASSVGNFVMSMKKVTIPKQELVKKFMHGFCDMFARAVYRIKGWQIAVLLERRDIPGIGTKTALVRAFNIPDLNNLDEVFDARGYRNMKDVQLEFNPNNEHIWMQPMSEEDLIKFLYRPGHAIDPSKPCTVEAEDALYLPTTLIIVEEYFR